MYILLYTVVAHTVCQAYVVCTNKKNLFVKSFCVSFFKRKLTLETQDNVNERVSQVCLAWRECKRKLLLLYNTIIFIDWVEGFTMYCIKAYESTFVINLSKYQYLVYKELSACRRELNGLITNTIDNLKY